MKPKHKSYIQRTVANNGGLWRQIFIILYLFLILYIERYEKFAFCSVNLAVD